jgi:HD-GYP domain-containing protein (c-di-GMP phosphodiesterase class II)
MDLKMREKHHLSLLQLKSNTFFSFFFRLLLIQVLVTLLGLGLVYWHFQYQHAKEIKQLILKERIGYEKKFDLVALASGKLDTNFFKHAEQYFESSALTKARLFTSDSKIILDFQKHTYPKQVETAFDRLSLRGSQEINYLMLPVQSGEFVLLYIHALENVGQQPIYLKIISPLKPEQVLQLHEGMETAFAILLITIILVTTAIFPIIYTQYKKLKWDKRLMLQNNVNMLIILGNAVAMRDSDTQGHNYRVTYFSLRLAEKMGLESSQIISLIKGSFLHDIGKIGISDSILLKSAQLKNDEFETMKTHVGLGVSLIGKTTWLQDALPVIEAHHEKFDGSGYPKGLKGMDIPLIARIFAVADVFDALVSNRPYKESWSFEYAIQTIRSEAGKHFDPDIVTAFSDIAYDVWYDIQSASVQTLSILLTEAVIPYIDYLEVHLTSESYQDLNDLVKKGYL